ncbi:MAG: hypothetical protein JO262_11305 [Solirubrobacterales bacterium]|nr:hypothetical protein [Solirubrobacterales bacterium]MBV9942705.1 hypothetical protein [Solirubrobacterales bacterium]
MPSPIDSTLDELEGHLRELKREVARLEGFCRQLEPMAEHHEARPHMNALAPARSEILSRG